MQEPTGDVNANVRMIHEMATKPNHLQAVKEFYDKWAAHYDEAFLLWSSASKLTAVFLFVETGAAVFRDTLNHAHTFKECEEIYKEIPKISLTFMFKPVGVLLIVSCIKCQ